MEERAPAQVCLIIFGSVVGPDYELTSVTVLVQQPLINHPRTYSPFTVRVFVVMVVVFCCDVYGICVSYRSISFKRS